MNKTRTLKYAGMATATIGLIAAFALGFFLMRKTGSAVLSCGIWLIGAGLWLYFINRLRGKGTKQPEKAQSLLSDIPRLVSKKIAKTPAKAFKKEMRELSSQALRMEKKSAQLDGALREYFGTSRISYEKFARTINGVLGVYEDNVSKILGRIDIFDEDGYEYLFKTHQEYTDAIKPYQASFEAVRQDLQANENILSRMEQLQKEVAQLDQSSKDLSELSAMQDMQQLIEQTKRYSQN